MSKRNLKKNKGFVALMSSIIISVILLLLATNLSFTGFYSRFNILDSEMKERSSAIADACIDIAILKFFQGTPYSVDTNVTVGENTCLVGGYTTSGTQEIFKVRGVYSNTYTNMRVVIDGTDFSVISVEEILNF